MTQQQFLRSGRRLTKVLTSKIFTTFYRRVVVVVHPIKTPVPKLSLALPLVIARLESDEFAAYDQFRPRQRAEVKRRGLRGAECFVARHEGQIVHATWVATGRVSIPYLNRDLMLENDQIYVYDAYTLPAYRGQNIAPVMFAYIVNRYWELGFQQLVAVATLEKARRRFYEKYGGSVSGVYSSLGLGRWQTEWQRPGSEAPMPFVKSGHTG